MTMTQKLIHHFWSEYLHALEYNLDMTRRTIPHWENDLARDATFTLKRTKEIQRIGYIVATCSPVTRGHLKLALQAANDLQLDVIYFLLWPFHYIPGFHNKPIDAWVEQQRHIPWEQRQELVKLAIAEIGDPRLQVLPYTKQWYEESQANYMENNPLSAFWTGTWYVIRKLQWAFEQGSSDKREFFFVCGMDQFNPNIDSLIYSEGGTQVWKDYSIAQHLAIHHIYTVSRGAGEVEEIEAFSAPFGIKHDITIGKRLRESQFSATQVRFQTYENGLGLRDYVMPSVADRIIELGLWGYRAR